MFGVYSQQGGASITLNETIITGSSGDISTSLDGGATWTTITVGVGTINFIIWGNNEFVFIRSGTFFTSPDGINWTNTGVTLTNVNKIIYAGGYYFVSTGGLAPTPCHILARQSFSSGTWTELHTAPTTGQYIDTLTYYDGRVYFIQQTATTPTFHSILISNLTVTNYGVMNSGIGAIRMIELYRVHNGWVAGWNNVITYTTTNTGWGFSSGVHNGARLSLVTDANNFTPPRDYVSVFSTNSAGTVANGARFDGTGNTGSNTMRNRVTNVYNDGTYFYCYDSASVAGVYRRLITNWTGAWTRDAGATTAGLSNINELMATGGTPNNVYIRSGATLYKTVSGSGTYSSLGGYIILRFAGRV